MKCNGGLKWVNSFVPSAPFLYPLKTSENRKGFLFSGGVENGCIGNEWVNGVNSDQSISRQCSLMFALKL